ncbi:MAG: PBP1A family penicillin-binding protein [Desulfobacteraceae bacterium]|nr:PBP1A family penicillin-binding protein [Desulfobacteraceae bacterium]
MKRILKFTLWLFSIVAFLGVCTAAYFWYVWSSNLPYIGSMKEYRPPIITEIYSDDGEVIGRFWEEKRIVVPLDGLPKHLTQAFIAAEDSRFFEHEGVDIQGIIRALMKNLAAGKIEQGGSTITQQVTKSLLLKNTEKTYRRKAREATLSIQLEKSFSKEEILFLYLNQIYLGQGAYGVEAAARTYFGKPAKDLSLAQSALLAGLPQAPARYSPVSHFDRAKARQKYALERMREEGYISDEQFQEALDAPVELDTATENTFARAPYFSEQIRRYLLKKYGRDLLYRGGLKIYTTLDLGMQIKARDALTKGLAELDKREGYRGPLRHLEPEDIYEYMSEAFDRLVVSPPRAGSVVEGLVLDVDDGKKEVTVLLGEDLGRLPVSRMKWARRPNPKVPYYNRRVKKPSSVLKRGDVILVRLLKKGSPAKSAKGSGEVVKSRFSREVSLEQTPEIQSALLCMVPETGEVKAMVGGRDFQASQFNRAIQSSRQPGSAFKPIIYAAALDKGMSPVKVIMDAPFISEGGDDGKVWKPKNYKEKFFGPTLFRTGLIKSRNVITVKLLKEIGINYAVQYARMMGVESDLGPDLSLALGASGVSLVELTRAYAVFANGGMLVKPIFVKRIVDRGGQVIEENQPEAKRVISGETAYVMTDLLKAVIQEGTGRRIKALKRPAAGKTGTTNHLWDAWFMGYTPELVTGVWVGYDDRKAMGKGETGSRAASPIWLHFMTEVLKGRPVVDFEVPEGVVFAKIDAKTGLLAGVHSKKTVFQTFKEGTEPKKYSPSPKSPKSGQFLELDMAPGK